MIIAIDFDGTLHTGQYPTIGSASKNARIVMQQLKTDGHYLIIWTCREGEYKQQMEEWLRANEIPFDSINENNPDVVKRYGSDSRKIYAHLYIDDKQVGKLPTWRHIYQYIRELEFNYKRLNGL